MKNNIKVLRSERNLTQEDLAKIIGISRVTLSQIENDRSTPDGNTIAAIVRALQVPANKIFFDLDVVFKQHRAAVLGCTVDELLKGEEKDA